MGEERVTSNDQIPPMFKVPTRVEWENNGVDIYIDDDDEALLMTAQESFIPQDQDYNQKTEELFSCLQKLVIASMSIGLIGLGVAFIFLIEYMAGW